MGDETRRHPDKPTSPAGPWWWACEHPERPHDVWALYAHADDCRICAVALHALAARDPGMFMERRNPDGTIQVPASSATAEAAALLAAPQVQQ